MATKVVVGKKIPRYKIPCRFDSGPGHHFWLL